MENKLMVLPTCTKCGSTMVHYATGFEEVEQCGMLYVCTGAGCGRMIMQQTIAQVAKDRCFWNHLHRMYGGGSESQEGE